MKWRLQ